MGKAPIQRRLFDRRICTHGVVGYTYTMATATKLRVWIDQDLCTGDGICEEITPDVFTERGDGLWVVKEEAKHFGETILYDGKDGPGHGPEGARGLARIPDHLIEDALESAEECPGECIMIEPIPD